MRTDVRCEAHRILHFIGIAIATPATRGTLKCPGAAERTTTTTKKGKIFYSSQKQITILVQKFISSDNIFCFVQLRAKKKQKEMEMSFLYA